MRRFTIVCFLLMLTVALGAAQDTPPTPATSAAPQQPATKIALISPIDNLPVEGWELDVFATTGVDTDFCYIGASTSYYQKLIATDPRSGYTGYPDDFFPHLQKPLPEKVVAKIKKKLSRDFDLKKLEPWDRYEILARIYIWRKMPDKDIANAYLRATYTMRGLALGKAERDREYKLRKKAIKYFRRAMDRAAFKLPEVPQLKYLIGDLYRRNGKFNKAIRFFEDAAKMKNRPEWLDEMIIRQMARAHAYDDR